MKKKHGKKYLEAKKLIEKDAYKFEESLELLKKTSPTKFDASCEIHMNLGVDPKQAEENIRTTVSLPHGTGKDVKVIAFVGDDKVKEAKDAGAVEAGTEDLIQKIQEGWLDFDVAVASPDQMKSLGKIAKILGQKGLMPNPKIGTITPDFAKAISEIKKGRIELRVDKEGNIHSIFGKVSFDEKKLAENLKAVIKAVLDERPTGLKGSYVKSIILTTSMGPAVPLDVNDAIAESR